MRSLFALLALVAILAGCASVADWLAEPAEPAVGGVREYAYVDPETGAEVVLAMPVGEEPEPLVFETDEGTVTVTPAPMGEEVSRGEVIAGEAGRHIGQASGVPLLAVLLGGLMRNAARKFAERRRRREDEVVEGDDEAGASEGSGAP